MTDPNPDAEKAALAEALEGAIDPMGYEGSLVDWEKGVRTLLAGLSPAAKALLEKAQAHDAMKAEVGRLREAVWAVQEWWRVSRDEIWNERKGCIEFILGRVKQCIFCKKSLGPQENKDSQGDGWWGCWPPCEPRAEALAGKEPE